MSSVQSAPSSIPRLNVKLLSSRLLLIARAAWPIYVTLLMTIFVAGLQVRYIQLTDPPASVRTGLAGSGISIGAYATYNLGLEIFFAVVFVGVAALIYARNSDDSMGVFTAYTLVTFGTAAAPITLTMDALGEVAPVWAIPVRFLRFLGWALMVLFFYLFPDGKFVNRRLRPLVILTILLVQVPWNMFPDQPFSPWRWPAAYHVAVVLATWGPAIFAQFYRYTRIANRVRKQQTKWFVYGSAVAVGGAMSVFIPRVVDPTLGDPSIPSSLQFQLWTSGLVYLSALLLPITIGFSILKYRLWDIDIIINRTLVYVPLTGILAGVYAASVKIFQSFFETVLGTKGDVAVVMTTLLLVATFTPVKDAMQRLVDRRFKGPPNPAEELKSLLKEMRLHVELSDPARIARRVLSDLVRAFRASSGAVYIARGEQLELLRDLGDWQDGPGALHAPMICEGQRFGEIRLAPRRDGEEYTDSDLKLLSRTATLLACTLMVDQEEDAARVLRREANGE